MWHKESITAGTTLTIWLSCIMVVLLIPRALGQDKPLMNRFSHLTTQEGLTGNVITCLLQDHLGYIWIGTQNGLNRYDGYEVTRFQVDPEDVFSIPDNFINALVEDGDGDIWIGTAREGLCRYDRRQDRFYHIGPESRNPFPLKSNTVKSLFLEGDTVLWVGTWRGLNKLRITGPDKSPALLHRFENNPPNPNSLARGLIRDILRDPHGNLWVGTYHDGVDRITFGTDTVFSHFRQDSLHNREFLHDFLHDIALDQEGNLWVATGSGLFQMPASDLEVPVAGFRQYAQSGFEVGGVHNGVIPSLAVDRRGQFWVASTYHLHRHLPGSNRMISYGLPELGIISKGANALGRILVDADNRIWIGTIEGVFFGNGAIPHFQSYPLHTDEPLPGGLVRGITTDPYGYIWAGTEAEGISVISPEGDLVQVFSSKNSGLHRDFVTEVFRDSKGRIWVGMFGGGAHVLTPRRDPRGRPVGISLAHFTPPALTHWDVADITETRDGTIWLTSRNSLMRFDEKTQSFRSYPLRFGNEAVEDPQGRLWVATSRGLFQYDKSGDSLKVIKGPPGLKIDFGIQIFLSIWPDQQGSLWAGTPHGLYRIQDGLLELFQEKHGLAGNLVNSLQGDQKGRIWIGTQKGLGCLNPLTMEFRNYYPQDGTGQGIFSRRATAMDEQGKIFMGGDNGLTGFHPDSLELRLFPPGVVLTDLRVLNQSLPMHWRATDDQDLHLPQALNVLDHLDLKYRHKTFSIHFAGLAFGHTHRVRYAYRMMGFDLDWVEASPGVRTASYTNLNPGDYRFEVRASLDGTHWTERPASLEVSISPPWYRTTWAWILYGILVTALLGSIFYLRIQRIQREYQTLARIERAKHEERESVRKRSARDFHDEAGNKLTKLSLYTALTRQQIKDNPEVENYMSQIESNLKELSTGMRDFIWVLDPEKDSLLETLERVKDFGNQLFEHSGIEFSYQLDRNLLEPYSLEIKLKRHILLIFKEAMNNCLKYSQATRCTFKAELVDNTLSIVFSDNGAGFDPEKAKRGNGLNNMTTRAREINGHLEISASPGEGTIITFKKNITQMGDEN